MSNIKLKDHYWEASGVFDKVQNKTQRELNAEIPGKVDSSAVGAASGVASLDSSGKVPIGQLPVDSALSDSSNPVQNKVVKAALDGKAPVIYDTASGSVASFPDGANNMPLKSLVVNIEPVQAGSGDPSPENIRPISGWTGCTVLKFSESAVSPDQVLQGRLQSAGEFNTNTTTRCATQDFISAEPGMTYTVAVNAGVQCIAAHYYAAADVGSWLYRDVLVGQVSTFTTPANCAYMRLMYAKNDTNETISPADITATVVTVAPALVELPFPTEAGTVYGGTLDVTNGVLTVTHHIMQLPDDLSVLSTGIYYFLPHRAQGSNFKKAIGKANVLCDMLKTDPNRINPSISGSGSTNAIYCRDDSCEDVESFKSKYSSAMLVYELATPITYQLTPTEVTTLLGQNNIWADSGDSTVEYPADTKLFVQKINAPSDDDMTADTQIASGKYFIVGGNLYKSTTTIPAGDTIIPGTNCQQTNLAEALNALNA